MELETLFVIGMFLTFGALLMTGFPVAWVLGGNGCYLDPGGRHCSGEFRGLSMV